MLRDKVSSSNIEEVGYETSSRTLEVLFCSGRIYQYYDVDLATYNSMLQAKSIGAYFSKYIKNSHKWKRIDNE